MRWLALAIVALLVGCAPATVDTHSPSASVEAAPSADAEIGWSVPAERLVGASEVTPPAQAVMAPTYTSRLVDDYCVDRDLAAPPSRDIALSVLDRSYALPGGYVPPDLVPASAAGFGGTSGSRLIRQVIVEDLAAMRDAWTAAGLTITIDSAYRSYASQVGTFNGWVSRLGYGEALVRSARPGHSEHQLGTTLDVTSAGWGGRFGNWATETAEGAWLAANAWRYGFVMSYPMGSQDVTCFSYEPWHYRWIGREAAAAEHASGLYLRQFLEGFIDG